MERFKCPVAVHLLLIKNNHLFMQLRHNTNSFAGQYYVLAGHIEGQETLLQTAVREAKEEAGILIQESDLRFATFCHANTNDKEYIQVYFWCERWKGEPQILEPDKCTAIGFFDLNQLPEETVPQLKVALENAKACIPYYEYGWDFKE